MGTVDKHVTIREDQEDWLEDNPQFNLSGLVQKAIDDVRDGE